MDLAQLDRKYYRLINQWKSVHKFPGDTTRKILTHGLVSLNESSIAALPTLSSVKRTIRRHKSSIDNNSVNHDSAAELQVPERYKFTLKEETFLIYDSGTGDSNCILIFCAPKMLSLLEQSQSWYADGTFKVVPEQFYQLYTCWKGKYGNYLCLHTIDKQKWVNIKKACHKVAFFKSWMNPFLIMDDFEIAVINALESTFMSVVSGCFFSKHLSEDPIKWFY